MNGTFIDPIIENITNDFTYKNVCAWITYESFSAPLLFCQVFNKCLHECSQNVKCWVEKASLETDYLSLISYVS